MVKMPSPTTDVSRFRFPGSASHVARVSPYECLGNFPPGFAGFSGFSGFFFCQGNRHFQISVPNVEDPHESLFPMMWLSSMVRAELQVVSTTLQVVSPKGLI